jgi:hypothetical protein
MVEASYDKYPWRVVPDYWRKRVLPKKRGALGKRPHSLVSPLVTTLLEGKTVLVDYTMPYMERGRGIRAPYYNLYDYFSVRGYQLHVCTVDDALKGEYRKILLFLTEEPVK